MKSKLGWTIATILILVAGAALNGWLWFSKLPEKVDELDREKKKMKVADAKLNGPDTNPLSNRGTLPIIE